MVPLRQGWSFILPFAALGLFLLWKDLTVGAIPFFALAAFSWFFFRNPRRRPPEGEDLVVSPADGKVIGITEGSFPHGQGEARVISIFMSPLDVHVNRVPVECKVLAVEHEGGKFMPAFRDRAPRENERNFLYAEGPGGKPLVLVQVAGTLARRILCWARPGQRLARGTPFGAIVLGSRVDLYLPPEATLRVVEGQRVKAGETVVALWPGEGHG